jgi:hypothetical protein
LFFPCLVRVKSIHCGISLHRRAILGAI